MKNIFKMKSGKWMFEAVSNGKRIRKTFSSKSDAATYANNFKAAKKFEMSYFLEMSDAQIKDIKDALNLLPKNETLTSVVKKHLAFNKPIAFAV